MDADICGLDYFPENILIEVLSYLSVRELVRAGRVCKRWRRLVRDQRLWKLVDLTTWKGVTSRVLWGLLRQYLGCGLRRLRLRGLLLSARSGAFLSESWLRALSAKCPRLGELRLLHVDLRSLAGCQLLPPSLKVLELCGCELPRTFFNQSLPADSQEGAEAASSGGAPRKGKGPDAPSGISIETLILNNVPSFMDQHLQSLKSWERLSRLELRDTFRVTAFGLRSCAAKHGICGVEGLFRLKFLEIGITGRQGSQLHRASLGLVPGWVGLEELTLGGKEARPGLLSVSHLNDLKRLCLKACTLGETEVAESCRRLRRLCRLEFLDVIFQPRQCPPAAEAEGDGGGEEQRGEEAAGGADDDGGGGGGESKPDVNDPIPSLRRSLAVLLPRCQLVFTNCSVQMNAD